MTAKEKEAILQEIARLKEPEKQFILGWCAHAAATAKAQEDPLIAALKNLGG